MEIIYEEDDKLKLHLFQPFGEIEPVLNLVNEQNGAHIYLYPYHRQAFHLNFNIKIETLLKLINNPKET